MPRKLKIFQTSQGFYDLVIAAPSMKAALEAWGAGSNLFHQGFAKEVGDPTIAAAAMAKPGIVLRRPVGTNKAFQESAGLPSFETLQLPPQRTKPSPPRAKKAATAKADPKAARKAALAYEQEQRRQEKQRLKDEAAAARARERREHAVARAEAAFEKAKREHDGIAAAIADDRAAIDARAEAEDARWDKLQVRLQDDIRKARQ